MPATSAGAVALDLRANTKQFEKDSEAAAGRVKSKFAGIAGALGKLFAIKALADFGKQCIDVASDLAEVQNVVDVTFPTMSAKADEWAKGAAEAFGLSETMAKRYLGTFGSMAEAFGFAESQAYDMSTALTGLAGDVASFYNISQDEAYTKLKSVFSGETEALKSLGVVMTQAALDQYALANGWGRTTAQMSEAEKVTLRLAFVQNALGNAQGDFARTSSSWANQVKLLQLRFEELKASIGQSLILALTPVLQVINTIISALATAANAVYRFLSALANTGLGRFVKGASNAIGRLTGSSSDAAESTSDLAAAQDAAAGAAGGQAAAQAKLNRTLAGFDRINKLVADSASGGGGGGGVGGISDAFDALQGTQEAAGGLQDALDDLVLPERLVESFNRLRRAAGDLADTVMGGLRWAWENVLVPLGEWTMNELAPAVMDLVASKLEWLNEILEAFAPLLDSLYQNIVRPLASLVGDFIVGYLETLAALWEELAEIVRDVLAPALEELAGWIDDTVGPAFREWVDWMRENLGEYFRWLKERIDEIGPKIKEFADWFTENILPAVQKVFDKIAAMNKEFKEFLETVDSTSGGKIADLANSSDSSGKGKGGGFTRGGGEGYGSRFSAGGMAFRIDLGKARELAALWGSINDKEPKLTASAKERNRGALAKLGEKWSSLDSKTATLRATAIDAMGPRGKAIKEMFATKSKSVTLVGRAEDQLGSSGKAIDEYWARINSKTATLTGNAKDDAGTIPAKLKADFEGVNSKTATLTGNTAGKDKVDALKTAYDSVKSKTEKITSETPGDAKVTNLKKAYDALKDKTVTLSSSYGVTANDVKSGWKSRIGDNWKDKNAKIGYDYTNTKSAWKSQWEDRLTVFYDKHAKVTYDYTNTWWAWRNQWNERLTAFNDHTAKITYDVQKKGINGVELSQYSSGGKITYYAKAFAEGGFVPRNAPQLAIIGDNRREGEIVSPESKFQTMLDKAAGSRDGGQTVRLLSAILQAVQSIDPRVELDGRDITRSVVNNINRQVQSTGRSPLLA